MTDPTLGPGECRRFRRGWIAQAEARPSCRADAATRTAIRQIVGKIGANRQQKMVLKH
jgi:hypothetical protein